MAARELQGEKALFLQAFATALDHAALVFEAAGRGWPVKPGHDDGDSEATSEPTNRYRHKRQMSNPCDAGWRARRRSLSHRWASAMAAPDSIEAMIRN
jgi:hypothetical protein